MNFELLNSLTDKTFKLQAFSDFCEKKKEYYQSLISVLGEAQTFITDTVVQNRDGSIEISTLPVDVRDRINTLLTQSKLSIHSHISTSFGYSVNIVDAIEAYLQNQVDYENGVSGVDLNTPFLTITDACENVITQLSSVDLLDDLKTSLHSITALCASNAAILSDSIADRIMIFRDKLHSIFENAYSDISNTAEYFKNILENAPSVDSYLQSITSALQVNDLAADDSTTIPSETQIFSYTGASPIVAMNFDGVIATAETALNYGAKIVAGVINSITSFAKSVFKKMTTSLEQISVNPYDIIESDGAFTVDGFHTQNENVKYILNDLVEDIGADDFTDLASKYRGKWIKFNTYMSERLINISDSGIDGNGNYYVNATTLIKVKPLNLKNSYNILCHLADDINYLTEFNDDNINDLISNLTIMNDIYSGTKSSEQDLCASFMASWFVDLIVWSIVNSGVSYAVNSSYRYILSTYDNFKNFIYSLLPPTITNLSFIEVIASYDSFNNTFGSFPYTAIQCDFFNDSFESYTEVAITLFYRDPIYAFFLNKKQEIDSPYEFPFLAYRNNISAFDESRFSIKSDEENQAAFSKFLETAVSVIIIAAVSLTAIISVKKILRRIKISRVAEVGRMDNDMWNGARLSANQARRYFRLQKKLNGATNVTSGLMSAISSAGDIIQSEKDTKSWNNAIVRVITG